tara:strand:- start:534 stop:728 length:195 start_codon:yes stop_codon:yes gene_type:complete
MSDKKIKSKEKPKPKEKDISLEVLDVKMALETMAENVHEAFRDVYDKLSELDNKVNRVSDRLGL